MCSPCRPQRGLVRCSLILALFAGGCSDSQMPPARTLHLQLDLSPCFAIPRIGNDYLCEEVLAARLPTLGACLALQFLQGPEDPQPEPQVLALRAEVGADGGWLLQPIEATLVQAVGATDLVRLRLFLLAAGQDPRTACASFGVDTVCDRTNAACLLSFGRAETLIAGDGKLVLRYGDDGRVCGIECNDLCDPRSGQCRRVCYNEQFAATELCDGLDNNCDDQVDEGFFLGQPCEGVGTCPTGVIECDDDDASLRLTRCSSRPGGSEFDPRAAARQEVCDGLDNDCDGQTDEDPVDTGPEFPCGNEIGECQPGYQICVDGRPECAFIEQGPRPELCDGLDNDCDGETDEDFRFEEQPIGSECQGTGECGTGTVQCSKFTDQEACCSADPTCGYVGPGQVEECDGLDNDCDGAADEEFVIVDAVGELRQVGDACRGAGVCDGGGRTECQGEQAAICSTMPGGSDARSEAERCDGLDNDCDGLTDEDFSFSQVALGSTPAGELAIGATCEVAGVCGKGRVECAPDAPQQTRCSSGPGGSGDNSRAETCNGLDDDCDGAIELAELDGDGDRYPPCAGDCRDDESLINPGALERCNALDDDCDEQLDEGNPEGGGPCGSDVGTCQAGTLVCRAGELKCEGELVLPAGERCNGLDDDCDGQLDEDFLFAQAALGDTPAGPLHVGEQCEVPGRCGLGLVECDRADGQLRRVLCSSGPGGSRNRSQAEQCNGVDDDCDGRVDNGFDVGAACDPPGICGAGRKECSGPAATACSTGRGGSAYQGQPERCDSLDNDCDGAIDNGYNVGVPCDPPGICPPGRMECKPDGFTTTCSTGPGGTAYSNTLEICNQLDDDCDGVVDNGVLNACQNCGVDSACVALCGGGMLQCADVGNGPREVCEPTVRLMTRAELNECLIRFERASDATSIVDASGLVQQVPANTYRFNQDPVLGQPTLLLEEPGTNLLLWSADLSQTPTWSTLVGGVAHGTVTQVIEVGSPSNRQHGTASRVELNAARGLNQDFAYPGINNRRLVLSFWARPGTISQIGLELNNNYLFDPRQLHLLPGWNRYVLPITTPPTPVDSQRVLFRNTTAATGTFYLWGVQLEEGSVTSYIPSGGARGQRTAERLGVRLDALRKAAGTWTAWLRSLCEYNQRPGTLLLLDVENLVKVEYSYTAPNPTGILRCTAPNNVKAELVIEGGMLAPTSWVFVGCAWNSVAPPVPNPDNAPPLGVQLFYGRPGSPLQTASSNVALQVQAINPSYVRLAPSHAQSRDLRLYQRRLATDEVEAILDETQADYLPAP